ncbi:helix-turn-helix domain-containing protein [Ammoniphilus sp. CFH 90114]|uniref:helix-turn-helix domain-containing protein n=1 Tax=Ammoniphilus sp. CFH 90114 TaxID=2493665 RepID=UPI00100E30BF|nr:XRE family transcriptional regulator [Ammoniphilus sp. CFH 90114]RXT06528.1 cupin domain-containing protein [Ammoniphilus sp. CFH 90114]
MFQGERVRDSRRLKNLTLKELAELTGLSASLLSQIERGLVDPTVGTFWKICNALDIPIHQFFQEMQAEQLVVRRAQRRMMELSNANVKYHYLSQNQAGKIQFLLVEIQPGEMKEQELVSHSGEECGLVLQGELTVIYGNQEIHLGEGDSIHFTSTIPHRYINPGNVPSLSVWAMA